MDMDSQKAARLSALLAFALLVLSFCFGFNNYSRTEKAIITDLNQALQQTILANSAQWINKDTMQTYTKLSALFGNPVSIKSYSKDFHKALSLPLQENSTGIIVHVVNKAGKNKEAAPVLVGKDPSDNFLASDTVIWMSAHADMPELPSAEVGISFQGYANCTPSVVFALADKTTPAILLAAALLSAACAICLSRRTKSTKVAQAGNSIAFGNLTLAADKACFYKDNQEKLKLTPQQYTLMEMFFLSPVHILTRAEICDSLWPGKTNADETLNTLARRLRPLIEENTNLQITTDRGRAYILEIRELNL